MIVDCTMPNTRQSQKRPKMASDMKKMVGSVEEMKKTLFEELGKLREEVQDPGKNLPGKSAVNSERAADNDLHDPVDPETDRMDIIKSFELRVIKILDEFQSQLLKFLTQTKELQDDIKRVHGLNNKNCLVFYGIQEGDRNGRKDVEEICQLIKQRFSADVVPSDLDYVMRLGRNSENTAAAAAATTNRMRPMLVRFVQRWRRDFIYANKRNMKGTGVLISELLQKETLRLYKLVRDKVGDKLAWTWQGNVYICFGGTRVRIENEASLHEIINRN